VKTESKSFEAEPGEMLHDALTRASVLAGDTNEPVAFDFNGVTHEVLPMEPEESWRKRASERAGFPVLNREESAKQASDDLDRMAKEHADAIAAAGVMTEAQMRDADVPWIKTEEEFVAYVRSLADRPQDYGTCVYAMSMAAIAAKNYVAGKLGVTGFQAGAADMDFLKRARHMKHGFRVIDYGDLLYPQYWDAERTPVYQAVLRDRTTRALFAQAAANLIAKSPSASRDVIAHWTHLANNPGSAVVTPKGEVTP
jgi:hypothetical protein